MSISICNGYCVYVVIDCFNPVEFEQIVIQENIRKQKKQDEKIKNFIYQKLIF